MAESDLEQEAIEVNTLNEFSISAGQNLPNHSSSLAGIGAFIRQGTPYPPLFRTKQSAYRYAAYLILMAETHLPDEPGAESHDFETVRDAIRNRR